jgi:hypothetical protein
MPFLCSEIETEAQTKVKKNSRFIKVSERGLCCASYFKGTFEMILCVFKAGLTNF